MKLSFLKPTHVALVALTVGLSCSSGTSAYYYDPYLYSYYYPADVAYSSYYWTDPWVYTDVYYSQPETPQQVAPSRWTLGNAIRALARGDNTVCPGHVTVTPRMSPSACTTNDQMVRTGVTLVFTGCEVAGGGTVDGTIDVTAMQNASDPNCGQGSTITLTHTTTITNLTYKGSGGMRLVIPTQTDTGTNTFTFGQTPAMVSINSTGRFQFYDDANKLQQDLNFNGTRAFKFAGTQMGYTVDGLVNLNDNLTTDKATVTASLLSRTNDCCYPTGGSLHLARMTGSSTDAHTWTFGPTCGSATQDTNSTTLRSCQ